MTPKVLLFDVGGTVFDWKTTAIEKVRELTGDVLSAQERQAFADDCFLPTGKKSPTGIYPG